MTSPSAKEQADAMIEGLRKGKNIHDIFAEQVRTRVLIQGKTMEQWKEHFSIKIPDNPDIQACKAIDVKLMELHEEATFLKAMADASYTLGKKSYDTQYRDKFTALVNEYKQQGKKLPAKETLEVLASQDIDDIETGLAYASMASQFWKQILEDLNFKRRIIENATINNSVEAKMTDRAY